MDQLYLIEDQNVYLQLNEIKEQIQNLDNFTFGIFGTSSEKIKNELNGLNSTLQDVAQYILTLDDIQMQQLQDQFQNIEKDLQNPIQISKRQDKSLKQMQIQQKNSQQQQAKYISTPNPTFKIIGSNQPIPQGYRILQLSEGKQYKSLLIQMLGEWQIVAFDKGKIDGSGYGNQIHETYGPECGQKFIIKEENPVPEFQIIGINQPIPSGFRILTLEEGKQYKNLLIPLLSTWSIVAFDKGKIDGSGYGNQIQEKYGSECGQKFIIKI